MTITITVNGRPVGNQPLIAATNRFREAFKRSMTDPLGVFVVNMHNFTSDTRIEALKLHLLLEVLCAKSILNAASWEASVTELLNAKAAELESSCSKPSTMFGPASDRRS
jgi:hypothetical protein